MVVATLSMLDAELRLSGSDSFTSEIGVQIVGSGLTGTLVVEGSNDAATWVAMSMEPWGGGSAVTSATASGAWRVPSSGVRLVRVRMSAYTAGSAAIYALPVVDG